MEYRPTWKLNTIPDPVFYSEAARRRGSRRRKKENVSADERERLDRNAGYVRKYRAAKAKALAREERKNLKS